MGNSAGVSRKANDSYPTGAPGPCSQCLVVSELLIFFFLFVHVTLVMSYFLLCDSVFTVWSYFFDVCSNLVSLDYS